MTNIRLRIEDAAPVVGIGSVGTPLFAEAGLARGRGSLAATVAYRMDAVTPARGETV